MTPCTERRLPGSGRGLDREGQGRPEEAQS
jgi:hypothetical protein